jgi:signal transduction histidine kinase
VERETYTGRPDAWVSTTKMPLLGEAGQIIGTFGISRDVTAQVSAENMLARQASELSAQNERLRELDRLKDEFIAAVSHELRTPLTSIIGYIELLEEEGVDGPNTGRFAEVIGRNAEQLLRLVGDLLFLSRMRSGKLALELQGIDLADIAAADLGRIFERFYRTAAATRQVIPGTGLGLAVATAIADAHNGAITVESTEGQGSTFTVRLPLRTLPTAPTDPAGQAAAPGQ